MYRRKFLKQAALLSLAGSYSKILKVVPAQKFQPISNLKFSNQPDESFWQALNQEFSIRKNYVYLNNGTMGPSPLSVQNEVIHGLQHIDESLHYGGGEIARTKIAEFINADVSEISLTHNTTEGINIIAWGLKLKKGDEILMSSHEHVGNAMPWINRAEREGLEVKTFYPKTTGEEIVEQLKNAISKRTKVVALPHISCTIGQRFPIKEIIALCKEKGIYCMIDGAHGPGALMIDVKELDVDFYVSCCHKWMLGPKGTGFLYIKKELLDEVTPCYAGAYTDSGFDILSNPATLNGYNPTAHRYDFGTQNAALYKGVAKAVDFHQNIGTKFIEKRVIDLNDYLYKGLIENKKIEILNSPNLNDRSMMLGFKHKEFTAKELAQKASEKQFRLRHVPEANLDSFRVSTHIYNNYQQLDDFLDFINQL